MFTLIKCISFAPQIYAGPIRKPPKTNSFLRQYNICPSLHLAKIKGIRSYELRKTVRATLGELRRMVRCFHAKLDAQNSASCAFTITDIVRE